MTTRFALTLAPYARFRAWLLPCTVSLLCLSGCKKKNQGTEHPQSQVGEPSGALENEGDPKPNAKVIVEQIPDPDALKRTANLYWKGDYDVLVSELNALLPEWEAPNEARAAGLAHAWIALAYAEQLPEKAEPHVGAALEAANSLEDQEINSVAKIAQALSLVAMSDAKKAKSHLANLDPAQGNRIAALILLARAKTAINLAFDERDRLVHPEELDLADKDYREIASQSQENALIMGHVHEGLAAIAKFRGDSAQMCLEAQKAKEAYMNSEASELLRSGPERMISTGGCK